MRNRIGGVVRYNHHIYTYSDRSGVGAGNREMASAAAVVRNWSVCTFMHPELDQRQGKWLFCLIHNSRHSAISPVTYQPQRIRLLSDVSVFGILFLC